jgi:hypothetical protein
MLLLLVRASSSLMHETSMAFFTEADQCLIALFTEADQCLMALFTEADQCLMALFTEADQCLIALFTEADQCLMALFTEADQCLMALFRPSLSGMTGHCIFLHQGVSSSLSCCSTFLCLSLEGTWPMWDTSAFVVEPPWLLV